MALFSNSKQFPNFNWQREIGLLLLINTLIAIFLTVIEGPGAFGENLLISHSIGLSIGVFNYALCQGQPRIGLNWRTPVAVLLGVLCGFKVAHLLGAHDVLSMLLKQPDTQWRWIAIALMVSFSACVFFVLFYHSLMYKNELEIAKRQHAEAKQAEISAQLAMLQAQIEPHFLFNTLANIHSLISIDAARAKAMLEHLNDYLRASLSRTRQAKTSLADEMALISALLSISQIRLGERLRYQMQIPTELLSAQLPPLLLQPLVENALEHGIEPAIDGGQITISAQLSEDAQSLILRVCDTGQGLSDKASGSGIGLANVRGRLATLYGEAGQLQLSPNTPHGVIAQLRLPYQLAQASHV